MTTLSAPHGQTASHGDAKTTEGIREMPAVQPQSGEVRKLGPTLQKAGPYSALARHKIKTNHPDSAGEKNPRKLLPE